MNIKSVVPSILVFAILMPVVFAETASRNPQNLWPIMIVAGVIILILLAVYMRGPSLGSGVTAANR